MATGLFTPAFTDQVHDIPRSQFLYPRLGEIPNQQVIAAINGPAGFNAAGAGGAAPGQAPVPTKGGATPKSPGRGARGRGGAPTAAQVKAAQAQQRQQLVLQQQQQAAQQRHNQMASMMAPRPEY